MTKKEMVMAALERLGYSPQSDEDGDVVVRYQMKNILILIGEEGDPYLSMILPCFNDVNEGEIAQALAISNKVSRELRLVKLFVEPSLESVSASCEFYYTDEESLNFCIERSLTTLGLVRTVYLDAYEDLIE